MKILHICQGYFDSGFYRLFMQNLEKEGVQNIIFVPINSGSDYKAEENILFSSKKYNMIDRLFFFGKQNKIYYDIIEKIDLKTIDVIHAHNLFSSGYVAYKLNKKLNTPYIVAVRNTDVFVFFKYMKHLRQIGIKILRNASKVVFLSPAYKNYVSKKYIKKKDLKDFELKSVILPNGINNFFIENSYTPPPVPKKPDVIKLIYFGEITPNKNIPTTIKSCLELISRGYEVEYTIVGEVKYRKFNQQIKKHNFIKYHPRCNKQELLKYIRQSHIFVMPSITETFGLVYTEALSQGLPIIYTKGQGYDGYFKQGEVGYAVDKYDHKQIADSILSIFKNYNTISKNCLEGVKKFRWENITRKYLNLYKETIQ